MAVRTAGRGELAPIAASNTFDGYGCQQASVPVGEVTVELTFVPVRGAGQGGEGDGRGPLGVVGQPVRDAGFVVVL